MGLFDLLRMLFDSSPAEEVGSGPAEEVGSGAGSVRNPFTGEPIAASKVGSGAGSGRAHSAPRNPVPFDPDNYAISVEYENFRGEQKTFLGDWRSLRTRRHHISLAVAPTGQRISLAQDRIQNLAEVTTAVARLPTVQQRRVMAFHKNRGSTSPLYESLLDKFPEWR